MKHLADLTDMKTIEMSLSDIRKLTFDILITHGCDKKNASSISHIITDAERDGCESHGLFRLPGYIASLRSGKANGRADPKLSNKSPVIIEVDGQNGFAPIAHEVGLPKLVSAAKTFGVAVLSLRHILHFAALWPETEYLAKNDLVGMACTSYLPKVAPHGTKSALLGTNPISFAWPRKDKQPICFDMATSSTALGNVQIAAREGKLVDMGIGLDKMGEHTRDPAKIIQGMLLPFGGHKGSAISLMVELLSAGLTGDFFGFESEAQNHDDGGPALGAEFIVAYSPSMIAGDGWLEHAESFISRLRGLDGAYLPGERRYAKRGDKGTRQINKRLYATIVGLS
jgi:delta1-piperideine-2-carboxylate reductase